jgi:hypothetical protein
LLLSLTGDLRTDRRSYARPSGRQVLAAIGIKILHGVTWLVVTALFGVVVILIFGALMFILGEIDGELGAGSPL